MSARKIDYLILSLFVSDKDKIRWLSKAAGKESGIQSTRRFRVVPSTSKLSFPSRLQSNFFFFSGLKAHYFNK